MHNPLGGDSFGPDRGGSRLDQNSHVNLTDPRNNDIQKSSNLKHSNESAGSHGLSSMSGTIREGDWPVEIDGSDAVLKFINHVLLEEEFDSEADMPQDASALQAFEKSFYNVLGQNSPPFQYKPMVGSNLDIKNPASSITSQTSCISLKGCTAVLSSDDLNLVHAGKHILSPCSQSDFRFLTSACGTIYGLGDSSVSVPVTDLLSGSSFSKGRGGLEESIHTHTSNEQRITDSENEVSLPPAANIDALKAVKTVENLARDYSSNWSRGRKNHEREDIDYMEEERSRKHSSNYKVETELSEMFVNAVVLCDEGSSKDVAGKEMQRRGQVRGHKSSSTEGQKLNSERVDLTTLLTQCAEAVASYDQPAAGERLKLIRQHSSSCGDVSQRVLHCFANGLEARLAGTGGQIYPGRLSRIVNVTPGCDFLKALHVFISICPFLSAPCLFANRTISNLSRKKATLHIIDFGILYGFQWPVFLRCISRRPGGPPKLRITGIELPQAGCHPSEGVVETGRRLSYYCRRFNIPFEYCPIAKKWETIQREDLKICEGEFLAVNCLYRFRHLADDTCTSSRRDAVLDLIRSVNPHVFIHGVVNGTYNSPFFDARFRETLFYFSALFDMLEACLPREDTARMLFETEIYGNDATNVIACEGTERFERPETYKQWQGRHQRAGFRGIPLNQELLKEIREKVKLNYHKDFMIGENNHWMLLGWKGRIMHAISCLKPASDGL